MKFLTERFINFMLASFEDKSGCRVLEILEYQEDCLENVIGGNHSGLVYKCTDEGFRIKRTDEGFCVKSTILSIIFVLSFSFLFSLWVVFFCSVSSSQGVILDSNPMRVEPSSFFFFFFFF